MKAKIKKIAFVILNILFYIAILIFLLIIYCVIQTKCLNKDYANLFGYAFFQIATGSMSNTLNIGDAVIVKLSRENINVGDIIVYKNENYFITHRVIKIENNKITTKGDANNTEDEPINIEQICGKVEYIIPNIDSIKKTFENKQVIILVIITCILLGYLIINDKSKAEGM